MVYSDDFENWLNEAWDLGIFTDYPSLLRYAKDNGGTNIEGKFSPEITEQAYEFIDRRQAEQELTPIYDEELAQGEKEVQAEKTGFLEGAKKFMKWLRNR